MTSHRGSLRNREGDESHRLRSFAASTKHPEVTLINCIEKPHIKRIRQKATKDLRELAAPYRSCTLVSDNASQGTEGTGFSTLTGSSNCAERRHNRQRSRDMAPLKYTIYEDELQSRATQLSYISRPIDVDSMQEYEDDDDDVVKPRRMDYDDSQSQTTKSTYCSRPIDVDSVMEYDPAEYPEAQIPEERSLKSTNSKTGYYEGESLLEYSSDDESVDFETGFSSSSSARNGRHGPERRVASLKYSRAPSRSTAQLPVSVNVVGPIHLDASYLLSQYDDDECEPDLSFEDWQFPILDERDMDRELVGYMEGFEPCVEDLPPRPPVVTGRRQSDATSSKSSGTRVTFEI